jgi:hypothetical protein
MGDDEEDQETPFPEMGAHQLAAKTAWMRFFIREVRRRGYTIEDIIALLDEPGMTVEAAIAKTICHRTKAKLGRQESRTVRSGFLSGLLKCWRTPTCLMATRLGLFDAHSEVPDSITGAGMSQKTPEP